MNLFLQGFICWIGRITEVRFENFPSKFDQGKELKDRYGHGFEIYAASFLDLSIISVYHNHQLWESDGLLR
jgi:hypothetical protein